MKIFSRKDLSKFSSGFTIIEMITVCAIVFILSAIAIFDWVKYSDRVELNGSAQKIVLALREAQVWGTATKEFPVGSGLFGSGFGINFDTTNPDEIIFFADSPSGSETLNNNKFDGTAGSCNSNEGCIEKTKLKNGYKIDEYCLGSDENSCNVKTTGSLYIVFDRPVIGAVASTGLGPTIYDGVNTYNYAKLQISSPKSSDKKYIEVDDYGTIRIK